MVSPTFLPTIRYFSFTRNEYRDSSLSIGLKRRLGYDGFSSNRRLALRACFCTLDGNFANNSSYAFVRMLFTQPQSRLLQFLLPQFVALLLPQVDLIPLAHEAERRAYPTLVLPLLQSLVEALARLWHNPQSTVQTCY